MGYANFKQYDSRWGSKNYNGSSTMAQAGCGPTAVADLAHKVNPKLNPWKVAKYMKANGYAIYGKGTAWDGIPAAMKNFGLINVKNVESMSDVFGYLKNGYCAVFLFSAGTRGGVTWTTAGHFVAVTAIKIENDKHYLWTRDPGSRGNNGWHAYETTMMGLIPKVWVGKVPALTKGEKIYNTAVKDAWKYGTKKSKYAYPDGKRKKHYTKDLKKAYGSRSGWGKQTRRGASCDVFVGTVIRASGADEKFPRGLDEQIPYLKKHTGKWKKVSRKKKNLKKGDIIVQKYNSGAGHIMVYMGGNRIANAHYCKKTYPIIEKYSKIVKGKSGCRIYRVYRAK